MWRWPHVVYKGWVHFFSQILQPLANWTCSVPLPGIYRNYQKEPQHWCLCTRRRDKIIANRSLLYGCQKMLILLWPVELSLLKCQKVKNILPTQYHATLGFPINYLVPISKPKQAIFYIVDVCIYRYIIIFFATWIFNFSVLSQLSLIHWLSSSLLLYEWFLYIYLFIYIYIFSIFLYKITLFTPHISQYWIYSIGIYMNFTEWVMKHISKTILKENKEVVNLILPKTSNNYCTLRNLVKSAHFKGSQFQL